MFGQQIGRSGRRVGQMAWGRILSQQSRSHAQRRWYSETAAKSSSRSGVGKVIGLALYGVAFGGVGAAATWYYMMGKQLKGFSDAQSLTRFEPSTEQQRLIEERINKLPFVQELRSKPGFTESRPHMKMPPEVARQSLTGGSLMGDGRLIVPPYIWLEDEGKSLVCVGYAGPELCGYPGKVHGGFLATMLDEGLARCCFRALPHNIAMTARLEIDYRKPATADDFFVMRAKTTKVEGRKAWVEGHIETLPRDGEKPVILTEAKALFVSPKFAAVIPRIIN